MPSSLISWTAPLPFISRSDIPANTTPRRTYRPGPMQCRFLPRHSLVAMTGKEGQEWWDVSVNAVVVHQLDLPPPHHLTRRHTSKYHTTSHLPPLPVAMEEVHIKGGRKKNEGPNHIIAQKTAEKLSATEGHHKPTYQDSPMRNRRVQWRLHSPLWRRHFARSPQHRRPSLHFGFPPSTWSWTRSSKYNRRWRCHSPLLSPLRRRCR